MFQKTLTAALIAYSSFAVAQKTSPAAPAPASYKISVNQDSSNHYYQKGLAEKRTGRNLLAMQYLEKALAFQPGSKIVLAELAPTYYELRKYGASHQAYQELEAQGEQSPAIYKQLVQLSFNLKKPADVVLYAKKLKAVDPSAQISFMLGKVEYEQENYGEAIKHLITATKEEPANAEAPYLVARSYADMLNYKQAVPFFQKAIELDPSRNNWIYELGLIYYAMHADKDALKYIQLAGEKGYKRDNEYLENLGIAYLNTGNLEEGVKILDEVLKRRPSDLNVLNMVAEAYYVKGKYPAAIEYWDRILEYDKENASALYMIGMSYQKKGEKAKGIQLCEKAIEMDPSLTALKQKKQIMGL